jgi:acetylglutamate kinase
VKVLIKVGGTLLDDANRRDSLARQLASVHREHQLVIVHGGGKQVTRHLEERGVNSRFVNGLRVSDEAVIDAVTKVISGSVNKQFVAALTAAGEHPVGLSGLDGRLTEAAQMGEEMGYVGIPGRSDARLLNLLLDAAYLPVVACVAGDGRGAIYNVNADQMAVSCAMGFGADRLIFLTDVPGVKDAAGEVLSKLDEERVSELIRAGVAQGGMRAKLEAAMQALDAGVAEIVIAAGEQRDICQRLLGGEAVGTRLICLPTTSFRSSA